MEQLTILGQKFTILRLLKYFVYFLFLKNEQKKIIRLMLEAV
jgi:hypothetical protein